MTHPDIIRYFMTIPEASRLVLQAAAIGESGQVLVLDMGEPVRIADLARELIRLAGYSSDEIAIEFTGLRAGEKLFEELLASSDDTLTTSVPRLLIARLGKDSDYASGITQFLRWAGTCAGALHDAEDIRRRLQHTVPEFQAAS